MNAFWSLTVRELKSLVYSPIAYVVGALFTFLQGWVFWVLVMVLVDPRVEAGWNMAKLFFGGFFYWLAILITIPTLTMRTFSEEKRTGSIEFLLTAPVTDLQVVLAKFAGAWIAYSLLWLSTIVYFVLLRTFTPFDWAPVVVGYLGTILMGGALTAIGVFASSLTRNQVISGLLSFVVIVMIFSLGFLGFFVQDPQTQQTVQYLSLADHIFTFSKGIIDTQPVVLYGTLIGIFLLLTVRVIGNPRWRA